MRILIVNSNRQIVGGAERYLQSLLPHLVREHYEIGLAYSQPPESNSECIDSFQVLPSWCLQTLGVRDLLSGIEEWRPSIVFMHDSPSYELESALLDRYPCVLFVHDYHRTCPTGLKSHAFPSMQPCARQAGPACLLMHFPRRCGGLNALTMIRGYERQQRQCRSMSRYNKVLVASRHMQQEVLQHGVAPERVCLAPLFPTEFTPDPAPPAYREPQGRLLFMGRLVRSKGLHLMFDALEDVSGRLRRPVHLSIAGSGPEEQNLRAEARRRGLDAAFLGWLDRDARLKLMRQSDLLVVPSLWPEPLGLVGLEAGCVGLPAVAFANGGIKDWLIPGTSGEAAGTSITPAAFTEAIVRALKDGDHYHTLRTGAWNVARQYGALSHAAILGEVFREAARLTPPGLAYA